MDKNVQIGMLCDIYGELLTERQQDILDLYYNNNLSLAEIAEEMQITRQSVRDSILKGEKKLFRIRRRLEIKKNRYKRFYQNCHKYKLSILINR